MIQGSLKNTAQTAAINPKFKAFFDYVNSVDLATIAEGKIELDGDDLFVICAEIDGKEQCDAALEAHHKYIDIQLLLSGNERMGWKPLEDASDITKPYNEETDLVFYAEEADDFVNLKPGQFAVFFPEDLHAPGIGNGKIRKLIAKVRV